MTSKNDVNGEEHIDEQGRKWWMGTLVHPCSACGIAVTNVDDCGHFGDPDCPAFGIGREAYESRLYLSKIDELLLAAKNVSEENLCMSTPALVRLDKAIAAFDGEREHESIQTDADLEYWSWFEEQYMTDRDKPKPDTDRPSPAPVERPTADTDRTIHTGSLMDALAARDAECPASGAGHNHGPNGPYGQVQCGYCGQSPPLVVDSSLFALAVAEPSELTAADYEEVLDDHRRLVRELDVALNGKDAALQASLCDLMSQLLELASGYYEVLAGKSVWVGGDYNGHYGRTLDRWLFPTKAKAEAFVTNGGTNGYDAPSIAYRVWYK